MVKIQTHSVSLTLILLLSSCLIVKGKGWYQTNFIPQATQTVGASYKIICWDEKKRKLRAARKNKEMEQKATDKKEAAESEGPPVYYIDPADYKGGCKQEGMSSVFFLFHMFPATAPLDPGMAMTIPVQEMEGDTMINMRNWHEVHYFWLLGKAIVYRVRGDVIKFEKQESSKKKRK